MPRGGHSIYMVHQPAPLLFAVQTLAALTAPTCKAEIGSVQAAEQRKAEEQRHQMPVDLLNDLGLVWGFLLSRSLALREIYKGFASPHTVRVE